MGEILLQEDFITEVNYLRVLIAIAISLISTYIIEKNYLKYSNSRENKIYFTRNLYPFSLAMLLIVITIKSSLALSLGLVGALSIIRFRTAIKEPEQLTTLLIIMAISVSLAAEKELLGIIFLFIYIIFYPRKKVNAISSNSTNQILQVSFLKDDKSIISKIVSNDFSDKINRVYKTKEKVIIEYTVTDKKLFEDILNYFNNNLKIDIDFEIF